MNQGERVQVQTKSFKGMATILYIAPGELYPIQVEMDEPDPDGHKIYRVASHEIVDELPAENETPAAAETFADPEQLVGEVVQEVSGYSFKKGQRFLLEKRRPDANVYYVYALESRKFRGCMHVSMFQIIDSALEKQREPLLESVEMILIPAEVIPDPLNVRYEQMTLLDFL